MYINYYTGKGTSASSSRVPNFSHEMNKMRLAVLLEMLGRTVPIRAIKLPRSPAPAPSEVPPQQLLLCAQHRGQDLYSLHEAGLWFQLSDPITGMGKVGDNNSS